MIKKIKGVFPNYFFKSHFHSFRKFSLIKKITLGSLLSIILFSFSFFALYLPMLKDEKLEERKNKLKTTTEIISSILSIYEKQLRSQAYLKDPKFPQNIKEAKNAVLRILRDLRYNKNEFFFIIDGSGKIILHPSKPEKENISYRSLLDSKSGKEFYDLLIAAQRDTYAHLEYMGQTKYSSIHYEKQLLFAQYYWPWDWIILTQIEIKDIYQSIEEARNSFIILVLSISLLSLLTMFVLNYIILKIPLYNLLKGIERISHGDLTYQVTAIFNDELGSISSAFNMMTQKNKRIQDELSFKEQEYRTLLDNLNVGIYRNTGGRKGEFLQANPMMAKMFAYDRLEDFMKLNVSDLYANPEERARFVSMLKRNGECKGFELQLKRKDGSLFWAALNARVQYDSNGDLKWIDGAIEDISELKEATEELIKMSEELEMKVFERTEELAEAKSEVEALNHFTRLINSISNLDAIFTEISKHVYEKYHILASWLFLPDKNEKNLNAYKVYSYDKVPEDKYRNMMNLEVPLSEEGGILYLTFKRQKPLYLPRIPKPTFKADKGILENLTMRTLLLIPLLSKNKTIGIYGFSNLRAEMKLSKKEIRSLDNLCNQISGVMETARLLLEVKEEKEKALLAQKEALRAKEEVEFFNDFSRIINSSNHLDEIFKEA
ncbi:MAG: cache domain-containing protein, partial [Leptospiraceae bacterium]|nr:cache domain-containing protein [Leptospiraceae bacterium]